jgi:hypothetical protein
MIITRLDRWLACMWLRTVTSATKDRPSPRARPLRVDAHGIVHRPSPGLNATPAHRGLYLHPLRKVAGGGTMHTAPKFGHSASQLTAVYER